MLPPRTSLRAAPDWPDERSTHVRSSRANPRFPAAEWRRCLASSLSTSFSPTDIMQTVEDRHFQQQEPVLLPQRFAFCTKTRSSFASMAVLSYEPGTWSQGQQLRVVRSAQDEQCVRLLYALCLLAQNRENEAHNIVTTLRFADKSADVVGTQKLLKDEAFLEEQQAGQDLHHRSAPQKREPPAQWSATQSARESEKTDHTTADHSSAFYSSSFYKQSHCTRYSMDDVANGDVDMLDVLESFENQSESAEEMKIKSSKDGTASTTTNHDTTYTYDFASQQLHASAVQETEFGTRETHSREVLAAATYVHALIHRHEGSVAGEHSLTGYENSCLLFNQIPHDHPVYKKLRSGRCSREGIAAIGRKTAYGAMLNVRIAHAMRFGNETELLACEQDHTEEWKALYTYVQKLAYFREEV
ncbi:unnamed protein product [Amoebophrya sp. A120]|nr:unnamed protein product [Amoebophrya sp. A120]|eukprot:GSA120T00002828001.1